MFIQENLDWAQNFFYRHETQNLNDKKVSNNGLTSIFFWVSWNSGFLATKLFTLFLLEYNCFLC